MTGGASRSDSAVTENTADVRAQVAGRRGGRAGLGAGRAGFWAGGVALLGQARGEGGGKRMGRRVGLLLGWVWFWVCFSFLIPISKTNNMFEFKQSLNSTTLCTQANKINAPA